MQNHNTLLFVVGAALLAGCGGSSTHPAPEPAPAAAEPAPAPQAEAPDALAQAVAGEHRSEANRARDEGRNPQETLSFCGIAPDQTVVELSPGRGWYTEILAPYLREEGTLVAAPPGAEGKRAKYRQAFEDFLAEGGERYDRVVVGTFDPPDAVDLGEPGSADLVLTFRNTHSWIQDGVEGEAYAAAFEVLRPGGTFCVVQHRAPESNETEAGELAKTGYVRQSHVVAVAEAAGFTLDASSEVNANPEDTADHEGGVWALPPSLRHGDTDRERYEAIGESDRMTLRFRKPE